MADRKDTEGSTPSITIEGWDAKDLELANLLQEAADFLRKSGGKDTVGQDMTFRKLDTGELFIVSHRS